MALSLTTASSADPLSTAEDKLYLGIDHSNDDDHIDNFVLPAARQEAETLTHRAFTNQTYVLRLTSFPDGPIILPRPPLSSVTSVTYIDTAGDSQTWASSKYTVETPTGERALWATIQPVYGEVYPSTRSIVDAVTVTFVAGYGSAASSIPSGIKAGVGLLCRYYYDPDGTDGEKSRAAAVSILMPYLAWRADLRFD